MKYPGLSWEIGWWCWGAASGQIFKDDINGVPYILNISFMIATSI